MKHLIAKNVTLAAAALLSSFALSAEAASVGLSTARQTHGSNHATNPIHHLLFPADTYMIDDGTAEDAIGLLAGGDLIVLNEFTVIPGSETITSVDIAWGTPAFFDPSLDGLPYTVAIWSDPNGDGDPADAVLLTTASGVVADQGTDTFITTNISATITTPNFFVGLLITQAAGQYPAAFDEADPTFSNRSYIAGDTTPGNGNIMDLMDNDVPLATAEAYGLIGNWLVRANTTSGGPTLTLAASKHRQGGNIVVSLAWNSTGSGRIDVIRDGAVIATTDDDGSARDRLGTQTGSFVYQVCVADSSNCSNEVLVRVHPQGD